LAAGRPRNLNEVAAILGAGMSVTAAKGFRAAGVAAGLKANGNRDVALVVNDGPDATAAGVFTTNRVKAAPVLWSRQVLRGGVLRAVVLNSGGANACTGAPGFQDTHATAEHVAAALRGVRMMVGPGEVAVCSTGLIGERLPMPRLLAGVGAAVRGLSREGGGAAAEAIMTTDTRPKTTVVDGDGWRVGGMIKGAGMLAPALATMLCVLTTDAVADSTALDEALRAATRVTLDRVDSDGCLSTNDTVLLMASGASGRAPSLEQLTEAVTAACRDLARQLLADAEGATKEVAIEVVGAASEDDAVSVGRAVARNNLVKTALFGNDPNWGRILAAVGTTTAEFEADEIDVAVNGVWVCRGGAAAADRSKVDLSDRSVSVTIDLHAGTDTATIWTNDLSHGYVHENSAYST
jgi:glutamate N-acetyltransferase / amino-acid N-acetyltransferase